MSIIKSFRVAQNNQDQQLNESDLDSLRLSLENSYFSKGHKGYEYGQKAATELVTDNDWNLVEIPIDSLLDKTQKKDIVLWLNDCENEYGYFETYPDPIIIAPAFDDSQPLNMMPGYTIFDGWHRLASAIRSRKKTIMAYIGRPKQ